MGTDTKMMDINTSFASFPSAIPVFTSVSPASALAHSGLDEVVPRIPSTQTFVELAEANPWS